MAGRVRPEICRDPSVAGSSPAIGTLARRRLEILRSPNCGLVIKTKPNQPRPQREIQRLRQKIKGYACLEVFYPMLKLHSKGKNLTSLYAVTSNRSILPPSAQPQVSRPGYKDYPEPLNAIPLTIGLIRSAIDFA
ncbi:hypothetical protein PoB_001609100 [Plakobranchus ocellatus]|uniref:Uncharacterized protein n=1 Tax=Plakobranchus ocellatus TaxID=259542 RepID=A0AAV3YR17_9GAST|nr:hypothetical protein PoB_001609100 [Plakobranchus ocellatus]